MKNSAKYIIRIVTAAVVHYIIKFFDLSFSTTLFSADLRSIVFLLYFIVFTLIAWDGGLSIARSVRGRFGPERSFSYVLKLSGLALTGYACLLAFLFNIGYMSIDIYLLNHIGPWTSGAFFNKELYVAVFFLTMIIVGYNGVAYYYKHWQEVQLNNEKLKQEYIQARYQALKNQIDPHFFFNSLSVLSSLVYKDPDLSAEYITKLSRLYRYILDQRDNETVPLMSELKFLEDYIFLLHIRFGDTISFDIDISGNSKSETDMPPNTLQMLAENAVKHNRFSSSAPLIISIKEDEKHIIVTNNKSPRLQLQPGGHVGLSNIWQRYKLLTGEDIIITDTETEFTVKLPKVINASAENSYSRG